MTVWKEAQAARAGLARPNPDAFAGWRIVIEDVNLVDLRKPKDRKVWKISEAELLGDPAPPKCKEMARKMRRAKEDYLGLLYRSVRNPPHGACLALFLEKPALAMRFERVPEQEWKAFIDSLGEESSP
jgi:hypothetical protein